MVCVKPLPIALCLALALAAAAIPSASAASPPSAPAGEQCSAGMESSFCTVTAGPCHETTGHDWAGEVTYDWRSVGCTTPATGPCGAFSDSRGALRASCSTAATGACVADLAQSPPLVSCENYGPGDSSAAASTPCVYLPPHAGIDCTIAGQHCEIRIWLDLNPPNPTFDCLP